MKTTKAEVPTTTVWRATQVLLHEPALTDQIIAAATSEKGQPSAFADAYLAAKAANRYALDPIQHVVEAIAQVAGPDAVISGKEWASFGPALSPLALLLATKSATVKPARGSKTEILSYVSPRAQASLRATSENLAGLATMPVLQHLVDDLNGQQPLSGVRVLAVQHLFSSTVGLFDALQAAGIQTKGSMVFGKNYSTNGEVAAELRSRGFSVSSDYGEMEAVNDAKGNIIGVDSPLLTGLGTALREAAAADPPERLLLLDEGGKLNRMVHDVFPQYASLCTIVEQTTNGLQNMRGTTLLAPVVSVASSDLKRAVEGPVIGEDVAACTLAQLDALDPELIKGKTIGIIGYGAVGSATAEAFARRGYQVLVTDIDPAAETRAKTRYGPLPVGGSIEVVRRADALGAGIVVGCTGTGAMTLEEVVHLSPGAVLVSAASGHHEFPLVQTRAGKMNGADEEKTPMKHWQAVIDRVAKDMANPKRGPIVTMTMTTTAILSIEPAAVESTTNGFAVSFPTSSGNSTTLPWTGHPLDPMFFAIGQGKPVMVLRGGTPVNMDRDLPPKTIQLTRSMLFAACLQAVGEQTVGWKTFSPTMQSKIESDWRNGTT